MKKITFMGAGSTVFARNVLGDCLCSPVLREAEFALYDIDGTRLAESAEIIGAMNQTMGGHAKITTYLGVENRKDALRGADFVVNAIQVGLYDPCTIIDFEVPKKYGLRQTIADTLGIGGIMRALRTIPVMDDFARDMEEVCPDALFLNYTNPMAMLTGYMLRYTNVKTVGLCHSVQVCSENLLKSLGMEDKLEGRKELIAGINHMGWLLELYDREGNDLYPEVRRRAKEKNAAEKHNDMVRFDYIDKFGYYCTESSEHNAEYNMFYIKSKYPEAHRPVQHPPGRVPPAVREPDRGLGQGAGRAAAEGQHHPRAVQRVRLPHYGGGGDREPLQNRRKRAEYRPSHRESACGRLRGGALPRRRDGGAPHPGGPAAGAVRGHEYDQHQRAAADH